MIKSHSQKISCSKNLSRNLLARIHRVSILVTEEHIEKFANFSSLTLILSEPPQVMQMLHTASYACHYVCIVYIFNS